MPSVCCPRNGPRCISERCWLLASSLDTLLLCKSIYSFYRLLSFPREPFPTSYLFSSTFSSSSCWFAASAFHRLALFQREAYESQRRFAGRGAGSPYSGERLSLGPAQVWVWKCHRAVGGSPSALPAQVFFSSSPLCQRPI